MDSECERSEGGITEEMRRRRESNEEGKDKEDG